MSLTYHFARTIFARSLTGKVDLTVEGAEHLPREGGAILVCNHACDADPGLLMQALPLELGFLAAPFMGRVPIFRTLVRRAGSVAIGSTHPRPWRDQVRHRLAEGRVLVVFPEGQGWLLAQDFDAGLADFHPGFASFAYDARVPVVPMVIEAVERQIVPFKTSALFRRLAGDPPEMTAVTRVMRYGRCVVHVLPPIRADRFTSMPKEAAVPWLLSEARARMSATLQRDLVRRTIRHRAKQNRLT